MARKIDELGRIVLPVELRRLHGILPGDALAISVDGDTIVLRKIDDGCVFCRGSANLTIFCGRMVCAGCIHQLQVPDPRLLEPGSGLLPGPVEAVGREGDIGLRS